MRSYAQTHTHFTIRRRFNLIGFFLFSNRFLRFNGESKKYGATHITHSFQNLYESGSFLSVQWMNEEEKSQERWREREREDGRWRGWLKICNIENGNWIKRNTSWIFFCCSFAYSMNVSCECVRARTGVSECLLHLKLSHGKKNLKMVRSGSLASFVMNVSMSSKKTVCTQMFNKFNRYCYTNVSILLVTFGWNYARTHAHKHKPFNRLALKVTLTVHMIFEMVRVVLCCVDFFFGFASKMMKVTILRSVCECVWLFIYLLSFSFIRVQVSVVNVCIESIFFSVFGIVLSVHRRLFAGPFVQCTHSTDSKLKYWQI